MGLYNNEVEGMLLDVFTTSYSFNKGWKENIEREDFEQVRVLDFPFVIGFFLSSKHNPLMRTCIKLNSLEKYDSNDIYSTVLSYIQGSTVRVSAKLFSSLTYGSILFAGELSGCSFVHQSCRADLSFFPWKGTYETTVPLAKQGVEYMKPSYVNIPFA